MLDCITASSLPLILMSYLLLLETSCLTPSFPLLFSFFCVFFVVCGNEQMKKMSCAKRE